MTNDNEPKTLAELNVKPGDVVRYAGPDATPYNCDRVITGVHENGKYYSDGQKWGGCESMATGAPWVLVSRATPTIDLTTITTPFGLLDEATQAALKAHGGPYEIYEGMEIGWREVRRLYGDTTSVTYRVKPAPKRETVAADAWVTPSGMVIAGDFRVGACPVTATFTTIDGKIDLASYRLEDR